MNRDLPIQVKEQKQTKNKNKFHRVEDAKKIFERTNLIPNRINEEKKSTHTQLHINNIKSKC